MPQYASHLRIFGTDISEAMLRKAKRRAADLHLKNVEGLSVMDAEKLEFPDDLFDVVMAQYVVTAVPNPEAALDEFARVLRPGGELIILTRVSADAGMRRFIEQQLQPVVRPLGFRTAEFAWSRYAQWLAGADGMELVERRLVPPLGHFSLIRFRKIESRRRRRRLRPANATCHYDVVILPTSNLCTHVMRTIHGKTDEAIYESIANATVGRPSLLSSQSYQPVCTSSAPPAF